MDSGFLTDAFKKAGEIFTDNIGTAVMLAAYGYFTARWSARQTRKSLLNGSFNGHRAILGETQYIPSGTINAETDQEFYHQKILLLPCLIYK